MTRDPASGLYLPSTDDVRRHLAAARDADALPSHSLHLVVGDFHSFAKFAIFVEEVPRNPPLSERTRVLDNSLRSLSEATTVYSALLAIRRPGGAEVSEGDLLWRDAFAAATERNDAGNHGVYLVTDGHVGRVGGPAELAA